MSDKGRQRLHLAALLVVLLVVVARQFSRGGSGSRAAAGDPATGAGDLEDGLVAAEAIAEVDLARLDPQAGTFSPGRDPFRFFQPAPVRPAPPPPPERRPEEDAAQRQAQRAAQAAAATPPRPHPPAIDFRYLGSFGPKERKIAVFSDQNEIYNARQGDVIKERFLVVSIGYESADIGFVGFPSEPAQRLAAGG